MENGHISFLVAGLGVAVTWALTGLVRNGLVRRAVLDHPNKRSSHDTPTPRGGGIAVTLVVIVAWAWAGGLALAPILIPAAVLAALSWADDLKGLGPLPRLVAQAAAITASLAFWPASGPFFAGVLPAGADTAAAGLLWLWFLNLYNFMDGIDGITGVETLTIGLGVAAVVHLTGNSGELGLLGIAVAAAACGFLIWNWAPARIFLGDVGSIPLGFLLGWLLLALAANGLWAPAVILPLYYLADATWTLTRRALRGEKVWQAHREHFYQKAVQAGLGHGAVAGRIAVANVVLVGLALVAASGRIWVGLAGATAVVGFLLWSLATAKGPQA